ncbi:MULTISPECIES: pseudouridine synthase [unclassified Tenacibaculum]|uniref:pseudouridine synthase n=1 Tax=unclassified Tenacibaculum TaxID=2635139 RepID=UPI001F1D6E1A|nr:MULTISPECIES: pseudouridine synthase [unclassified Tenacibaculum]MCF2874837.1 pseudouridine synthase [Tenacibaculum sp. Cn5-1]MCF2934097.1 pseudouridine synthase [Tenacibaculum sp. Cn5-34]MCG7510307.1 pseudouridine synthase [Tenacibaculum sp. Cn5-46]
MKHCHFIIYKPYGFLSQFITNQKKGGKHKLLGELFDFPEKTMAVGRLDVKSEGLLLLTTDGKVSDFITTRGKVEKEYYVQVNGQITTTEIEQLENGVQIGFDGKKYMTKPCKVSMIDTPEFPERSKKIRDDRHGPTSWISVTLTEGKFRQVRKMTSAVGFPTLRLVRVRVGDIELGKMESGEVIEVEKLIN